MHGIVAQLIVRQVLVTRESGQGKLCTNATSAHLWVRDREQEISFYFILNDWTSETQPPDSCVLQSYSVDERCLWDSLLVRAWLPTFPEEIERPTCGKEGILRQRVPVRGLGSWKSESRPSAGSLSALCPSSSPMPQLFLWRHPTLQSPHSCFTNVAILTRSPFISHAVYSTHNIAVGGIPFSGIQALSLAWLTFYF